MFRSFRVGRLLGFPIDINLSFLLLLAFVGLWAGGFAGVFAIIVAFASILLHELGHAVVARHLGVSIAGIEFYFFGGAAKMLGQPKSASDEIAIAAAGPAVSFALAGIGTLLATATGAAFFELFAWINLIIAAFNLIPALPMDGGRILRGVLSKSMGFRRATELSIKVARVFAVVLGVAGLFGGGLQLMVLAVVLWLLGTAELGNARLRGYGNSYRDEHPGVPFGPHWVSPDGRGSGGFADDSSPSSQWKLGRWGRVHPPRRVGGFVIRNHGGRFTIEPL